MSYVEVQAHPGIQPAGLIGATGLSGGMLAALLLAASGYIATPVEHPPVETINLTPVRPKDIPPPAEIPKIPPIETVTPQIATPTPQPALPPLVREPIITLPPPGPLVQQPPKAEPEKEAYVPPPPLPKDPPAPVHTPVRVVSKVDPRFARDLQPIYPASMRRAGIEGRVVVRVKIGQNGKVIDFLPISAPDPAFFDTTREQAMKKWRFTPETIDGNPVESWKTMTLTFRFEND